MPTDAELRTLFHDAAAPRASLDAAAIIRRSKRRRLPQQLGAGSVLTLAVAGIGVASINGLQALAPMGASETMADAPAGVSEGAPVPWAGADSAQSERTTSCVTDAVSDPDLQAGLTVTPGFPATAASGQTVAGVLTLTNTGTEPVGGIATALTVTLSRGSEVLVHLDHSPAERKVALAIGESVTLDFWFNAVECAEPGDAIGAPLEPGDYTVSATLQLLPYEGPAVLVGGPASVISLR